jgi:hypothetical protein
MGLSVGQAPWRLGVTVREYLETRGRHRGRRRTRIGSVGLVATDPGATKRQHGYTIDAPEAGQGDHGSRCMS